MTQCSPVFNAACVHTSAPNRATKAARRNRENTEEKNLLLLEHPYRLFTTPACSLEFSQNKCMAN